MDDLVSTEWLERNLRQAEVRVLDATYFLPSSDRDGAAEYAEAHVPGAQYLDIDALSDRSNPAPHMLPSAEAFGAAMQALGVSRVDMIVIYDHSPLRTAARGWFMLRHFGAERVAVLDGGFGKWLAEDRPVESGRPAPAAGARFDAIERDGEIVTKRMIVSGVGRPILDARGRGRFDGSEADPRPGVAPGHIPESRNLPFAELYREDGTMKEPDELAEAFRSAGVDPEAPFVATCGSGVTANSLILAARRLGGRDAMLYDGSWSEWGADPATPKEMGSR